VSLRSLLKGLVGELGTRLSHSFGLPPQDYHAFNNLVIASRGHTTQIDHVIVSRFGVFVVETKNLTGWLFASQRDAHWTQVHFNKKTRIRNPIHQNFGHVRALAEHLCISPDKLHSVVVIRGSVEFKTPVPAGVITSDYPAHIRSFNDVLFSEDEVQRLLTAMRSESVGRGFFAGLRHAFVTSARFASSTTCPKCGGSLVQRHSNTALARNASFLGCSNYPSCRYTRNAS
jgi:hypothetical protein